MRTGALERHSFGSFDAVEGLAKRQLSWVPKLEMDSLTSVPASHYRADKLKRWFMVPIRERGDLGLHFRLREIAEAVVDFGGNRVDRHGKQQKRYCRGAGRDVAIAHGDPLVVIDWVSPGRQFTLAG